MKQSVLALLIGILPVIAQSAPVEGGLLRRTYIEGECLRYHMKGEDGGTTYEVRLTASVKKDAENRFFEEYAWSDLVKNGAPRALSPTAQAFRLAVTLEPGGVPFLLPDLSKAEGLVGPVTDLMTFYADLFLAMHAGVLRKPGDHFYFPNPVKASWADGRTVIIGEDDIDFDITLKEIDASSAVVLIKHVPPPAPKIRFVADWMRSPVADSPNNWVEVRRTRTGYAASVGKETFDVELRIDLKDGRILAAKMDNPVTRITRECTDEALTQCGEPRPNPVHRRIVMTLLRD
ncbi:MAG TPA: hypothetical protein VFQ06_12400 [Nitrospira sp.]|nr:hypothetical protein [Nitrospira sp.]